VHTRINLSSSLNLNFNHQLQGFPDGIFFRKVFLPLGVASCCASIQLGFLWCRQSHQSLNTSTLPFISSRSLHVSAPTGHLQVRYTIDVYKDYSNYIGSVVCCIRVMHVAFNFCCWLLCFCSGWYSADVISTITPNKLEFVELWYYSVVAIYNWGDYYTFSTVSECHFMIVA
jgi:hypothetical protein